MIKILLVDDHEVVRQGLRQIMAGNSDMAVTGEAATGREALDEAFKDDYDVVILDISLPDISGFEVLRGLKEQKLAIAVLMLSVHPESRYAMRALKMGASGYLTKRSSSDELTMAVRKIATGGKYVTSSLAEKLASYLEGDFAETPLVDTLSDQEQQVLRLLVSGKTIKQIAAEMFISPKTVYTYNRRLLQKLNLQSNVELIRYGIENELG